MSTPSKDAGIIQVLAERMEKQRLPRALALKDMVDRGERLGDMDIAFLEEVFRDAHQIRSHLEAHPEWQDIAAQIIHLYKEITDRALANEEAAAESQPPTDSGLLR
jgi:hypothetical protein